MTALWSTIRHRPFTANSQHFHPAAREEPGPRNGLVQMLKEALRNPEDVARIDGGILGDRLFFLGTKTLQLDSGGRCATRIASGNRYRLGDGKTGDVRIGTRFEDFPQNKERARAHQFDSQLGIAKGAAWAIALHQLSLELSGRHPEHRYPADHAHGHVARRVD